MPKYILIFLLIILQNISMNQSITEIFKIDKLRSVNLARGLFLILVILNLTTVFFPIGDNDFTAVFKWYDRLYDAATAGDSAATNELLKDVPLTHDNWIYVGHVLVVELLMMIGGLLYTGIYIRDHRIEMGNTAHALPINKLIFRVLLLIFGFLILIVPIAFVSAILFLGALLLIPYAVMFRACYLSGDYGFFGSFKAMFTETKGFYLTNVKNLVLLLLASFLLDAVVELVGKISSTAQYVLDSYLLVLLSLATARYIGIIYCIMTDRHFAFVSQDEVDGVKE